MDKVTIKYQYATYSGTQTLTVDESCDDEQAVAKMWASLRRRRALGLSMAYQSAKVISRESVQ